MKILLITDNHTATGGAENYFFDLKSRLKNTPNVDVYSIGFGPEPTIGDDYYVLKAAQSNAAKYCWRLLFHPIVYFKLRKQIKNFAPDIIHIHNVKQYSSSVLRAIQSYPVVQTMHDFSCICPTAQNLHKDNLPCPTGWRVSCLWQHQIKFSRMSYLAMLLPFLKIRYRLKKIVKTFIAPSPLLTEYLQKNNFQPAVYIPPFKSNRSHYSFEQMKPTHFLFAGNLGTHKGVHMLLQEFALACQTNNKLFLNIAGTGPEESAMRAAAEKLGITKNIAFLGWKTDMERYYQKAVAIIFSSTGLESFGLVMTEAMSYARPIIGVNRGTTAWLVEDKVNGLLFDPLKSGDLAEKILCLAENVELAKRLGVNGYEKLQKLIDNDEALKNILSVYTTVDSLHRRQAKSPSL